MVEFTRIPFQGTWRPVERRIKSKDTDEDDDEEANEVEDNEETTDAAS